MSGVFRFRYCVCVFVFYCVIRMWRLSGRAVGCHPRRDMRSSNDVSMMMYMDVQRTLVMVYSSPAM